jgi:hypothetical protein
VGGPRQLAKTVVSGTPQADDAADYAALVDAVP